MASGNIFKLLAEIKALKLDYTGAVKYLTDQGIEVVGIIKQGLDNFFKKIKARDPDFGNVVQKLQIDDQGIPFNPRTLKSTQEKRALTEADKDIAFIQEGIDDLNKVEREADLVSQKEGIENLFDEKLPNVKMGSRINYEKIAELEDIDVELIRGKNWSQIRAIIAAVRDKADGGIIGLQGGGPAGRVGDMVKSMYTHGGRVGFQAGGWADNLTGQALATYNSMKSAQHTDQTIKNTLQELGYWSPDGTTTDPDPTSPAGEILTGPTGESEYTGGGKWGNLDLSNTKDFTKDVFTMDNVNMSPMQAVDAGLTTPTASFKPHVKTGYYNPRAGIFQTFEGKNINHAGIPFSGLMGIAAKAFGFGEGDDLGFDYDLGQIAGTFTGYDPSTGYKGLKTHLRNKRARDALLKNIYNQQKDAEILTDNKKAADDILKAKLIKNYSGSEAVGWNPNIKKTGPTYGPHAPTDPAVQDLAAQKALATSHGGFLNTQEAARLDARDQGAIASKMGGGSRVAEYGGQKVGSSGRKDKGWGWREGGLATMFTRRR